MTTRYTVAKGTKGADVVRVTQEMDENDEWVEKTRSEFGIDKDTLENMAGAETVHWFNSVFGDGTFTVVWKADDTVEVVNRAPSGKYRTVEIFKLRR